MRELIKLKPYRKVGIDFDGTLADHRKSGLLWDHVANNPYDQEFFIVTHRSGGYQDSVWMELVMEGSPLRKEHFQELVACPHETWMAYKNGIEEGIDMSLHPYVSWKGEQCASRSIEVMIDDRPDIVEGGCTANGVTFIHIDDI